MNALLCVCGTQSIHERTSVKPHHAEAIVRFAMLVLSLFPGVGLLDMAFEEEGFHVVRGPDYLWGGDIRKFHPPPGRFDGIIGGPPCQAFSRLARMVKRRGYQPKFGNLVPEFERCVTEAEPTWFVMEEVQDAPVPVVDGYGVHSFLLNNRQLGDPQNRVRRWSFGVRGDRRVLMVDTVVFEPREFVPTVIGGHSKNGASRGAKLWERTTFRSKDAFDRIKVAQGLSEEFDLPPFTVTAKCKAVGNGVPLPMGRAIARAVKEAI